MPPAAAAVAHHGDVIARARPAGGLDVSVLLPGNGHPPQAATPAGPDV